MAFKIVVMGGCVMPVDEPAKITARCVVATKGLPLINRSSKPSPLRSAPRKNDEGSNPIPSVVESTVNDAPNPTPSPYAAWTT